MGNLTTVNYNIERKIKENFDNEAYINKETQNLKYKPIEEEYAYKIKEILKVCQLEREINLDILSNKIIIQHISKPIDVGENGYSCALFKDKQNSDFDENDEYELSLGVFDFDEESRIKGTTVYLQHWGSVLDFLDLSDALEQDENIYILKNISDAKQCGAICKLYRNVKNHEGIIKRQEDLIQKLGSQVVEYDDASWIIVNSIKKEDLNNEEKFKDVLHKFLEDFIKYAFTVEFISKGY